MNSSYNWPTHALVLLASLVLAACEVSSSTANSGQSLPDISIAGPDGSADTATANDAASAGQDAATLADVVADTAPAETSEPGSDSAAPYDLAAPSDLDDTTAVPADAAPDVVDDTQVPPAEDISPVPDTEPDLTPAPDTPAPSDAEPPPDAAAPIIGAGQAPPSAGVFAYTGCQAGGLSAQFVAENPPPASLQPGQTANVWLAFANCGSQGWQAAPALGPVGHKLGAQAPQDNKNWGFDRVALPADVAPNQVARIDFTITAPAISGPTGYQWQLVEEGVTWFGALSPLHTVDVQGGTPPAGGIATLADLWSGAAHFVVDQEPVPLDGVNSGHREAFAVNRTDLGPKTVYMYHRCFGQSGAVASICLSISSDGADSFGEFVGEIIAPDLGHIFCVAPSVAQVAGQWVMVYEESNVAQVYWAQSADGKQWSKKGALLGKPPGGWDSGAMATPSILVGPDSVTHVFYAGMAAGGNSMSLGRADGSGPGSLNKASSPMMVPPGSGWSGGQLSMPRVVYQNGWFYMVFEGADIDFTCEAYNEYGWGMARSPDLINWTVLPNNPLGQSKGGCGQDMPSVFIRFDGHVFVFHTSADTTHVVREHLALINP